MELRRALFVALAITLALIAGSSPRLVGDGGEYLVQALNFASLHGPGLDPGEIPALQDRFAAANPPDPNWAIPTSTVAARDGRLDFVHFWFYALLATPGIWLTRVVGLSPLYAFTLVNVLLLGLALRVALPRIGAAGCLLVFASPIIWWLDKAHTEAFTFALVTIALALARERPWWSMVASGLAATQNPPLAALAVLVFASHAVTNRPVLRDARFQTGAAAALVLAAIHPAYYLWRHGTPSLLLGTSRLSVPSAAFLAAPVLDPDIGLVANDPVFALVVIVAVAVVIRYRPADLRSSDALVAVAAGAVFLAAASQVDNLHHGGTPSISRYALWLLPLAVPFLRHAGEADRGSWRGFVRVSAALSAAACAFAFHPAVAEHGREPTWAASYLWTRHPGWSNPPPEIFQEVMRRDEDRWVPVLTPGCEKILLGGRGTPTGVWPMPCYPDTIPAACQMPGAFCYANLGHGAYRFALAPQPWHPFRLQREEIWPSMSEAHVRELFGEWKWRELTLAPTDGTYEVTDAGRSWIWMGANRCLVVVSRTGDHARVTLRLARPMAGRLVDAASGATLQEIRSDATNGGRLEVLLPAGYESLILALNGR